MKGVLWCLVGLVLPVALFGAVGAQPATKTYRVGMLWSSDGHDATSAHRVDVFQRVLSSDGFVVGRNVVLEHRYAAGNLDRFSVLASELVTAKVDAIVASSPLSIRAARQATATIPIVMINGDPAMFASFARPGGNITGLTALQEELAAKQVELLKEAVPGLTRIGVLRNPTQPVHTLKLRAVEQTARAYRLALVSVEARSPGDFDVAFTTLAREGVGALVVLADGTYATHRARLADLAAQQSLPTCFGSPGSAKAGGLIEYVPSGDELYRRAAAFVAKVLKGAHPSDLPVEQPTLFELSLNLKTARALRLSLPQTLILRADHIIE
jgi:putative ABC transport system substrate-binding protein